ncbi:MAG: FmdB family zinc ribbon protein [Planctomycetota bacterium]
MPLFEYECRRCRSHFELLIRGGETPECPSCHSVELERQLGVPAAHVQGGGPRGAELPMCAPAPTGGCGAPWCGTGGCER